MREFLADVWKFLTDREDHPIYRRELAGWSYLGFWRKLRHGCLPLMLLLITGTTGCCGLSVLAGTESPDEWPLVAFSFLAGLLAGGETIRWLVGLLATAVTSTTISAEVEAETYGLLRLTPIPARQIVLAKFGAAFRQFRLPLVVVAMIRAISTLGSVALFIGLLWQEASRLSYPAAGPVIPPPALTPSLPPFPALASNVLAAIFMLLAILAWFGYFLLAPTMSTLIYAAVGLLASVWSRTRAGGLLAAAGLRAALWGLSYITGQVISAVISLLATAALLPLTMMAAPPAWLQQGLANTEAGLFVLAGALIAMFWLALVIAGQCAVVVLILYIATRRAERLPFV